VTRHRRVPRRLIFFTELEKEPLDGLFSTDGLIGQLARLHACVSMGILDLSAERAAVVRRLNAHGIPLVAWQLLPKEQGYWYHLGSADQAVRRYQQFREWSLKEKLHWDAIGIDIEPDINEFQELLKYNFRTLLYLVKRLWNKKLSTQATATYESLIARMRSDGYAVHSYEYFFAADERISGSSLLSRLFGLAKVTTDKHVGMLYSSFFRPYGVAVLKTYATAFDSAAIGITGGGVELEGLEEKAPMDWDEFARDLRIAGQGRQEVHIFSLEGCARQGFLERLDGFHWEEPPAPTSRGWALLIFLLRYCVLAGLWILARPVLVLVAAVFILWELWPS
jgi:hypothetical protein